MKSKTVAALLALFLGGFGAHKFYLGKPATGVLYFVFCWTFVPSFIALIDMIIIIATPKEKWITRYGA